MAKAQAGSSADAARTFYPGQAQQLYDLLPGEKAIIGFGADDGADHLLGRRP